MSNRPTLLVQTVYFCEPERDLAETLGAQLYDNLTRPFGRAEKPTVEDRLSFGPGIPVRVGVSADQVRLDGAEHVLVVPVLGAASFGSKKVREDAVATIRKWHAKLGPGHVVPVLASTAWRAEESQLPAAPILRRLYDDENRHWTHSVLDVVLSAARLLCNSESRLHIFVSHAKLDLKATGGVAEQIRNFTNNASTGEAFFDTTHLEPGHGVEAQLTKAAGKGIFLAVRTDAYASRVWCQRELLFAKRAGVPTLTVELLERGELRSSPYAGNGPTIVWQQNPADVVLRAMVEWLRARYFEREAKGLDLPNKVVLPRPPELLDLVQGPLTSRAATVVLHPDPELSAVERAVLRESRPRLRLVTPTTLYRGLTTHIETNRGDRALPAAPLHDHQIALSLSDVLDNETRAEGLRREHLDDAIVHLVRCLVSAGASIAYGGDFRQGGFDELLAQLIVAYNSADVDRADYLYSYIAAVIKTVPGDATVTQCSLDWTPEYRAQAILEPPREAVSGGREALYFSDMRRVMVLNCLGRVLLGGQARPRPDAGGLGYGGPYPGVAEEAWHSLAHGSPLYVAGGFGGASALVASVLEGDDTPARLTSSGFSEDDYSGFHARAREYAQDPDRERVGTPRDMAELVAGLRSLASKYFQLDSSSLEFNGLTVAENRQLWRTQDPAAITRLVVQGLVRVVSARTTDKLRIEVVRGSITQADGADALAIATFRNVPVGGAGAALDEVLSHRVSTALRRGEHVVEIPSPDVDADWLILADLGRLVAGDDERLRASIDAAAAKVGDVVLRHGFRKLAIVTFGGNLLADLGDTVDRVVRGLSRVANHTTLQWFELDGDRFEELAGLLDARSDTIVSRRVMPQRPTTAAATSESTIAMIRYDREQELIHASVLPSRTDSSGPRSAALVATKERLTQARFEELARPRAGATPSLEDLDDIGRELAAAVFGVDGRETLQACKLRELVVLHDVESGGLPFETLCIDGHRFAAERGLVRRPSLEGARAGRSTARPPHVGALNVLLVVNPTEDLPGTEVEADAVAGQLGGVSAAKLYGRLRGKDATRERILEALADPSVDVLHYSGHAFFRGPGPDDSGLLCAGGEKLLARDLAGIQRVPRVVFFNACQSARVRGDAPVSFTRAFAEYFLRGGVESLVGTFWPVADAAAATFASSVYGKLASGVSLADAVLAARQALLAARDRDWANYVLYGDGEFRLVRAG